MPFTLPALPYAYDALAPHIDAKTMEIHHTKHHQAYITNANNLLKDHADLANLEVNKLILDLSKVPEAIRGGVRNNAGGHVNHGDPKASHGLLNAAGPDDGDLPNLYVDAQGHAEAEVFTTRARISRVGPGQWLWDEDGSALVIHANADDHSTQPIGVRLIAS